MKNIKNIIMTLFVGCLTLGLASCKKETENLTSVTEWPELTILGETFVIVAAGQEVTLPAVEARFASNGATTPVGSTGYIDLNTPGFYTLNFTAKDILGKFTRTYDESFTVLVATQQPTVDYAAPTYSVVRTNGGWGANVAAIRTQISNNQLTAATTNLPRRVIQMVPGKIGWYIFSDVNWQGNPVSLEFYDKGDGTFVAIPTPSGFGTTDGIIEYDPVAEAFTIIAWFTTGNTGLHWGAIYTKD